MYRDSYSIVLYDESHRNTHTADGGYKPLADLVRHDGCDLHIFRSPVSARALAGASLLVIVCARGDNDASDDPAFLESENAAIDS